MPRLNRLGRLARLATLPETRGAIIAAARSTTLRTVIHRGAVDRAGLLRDLATPANARHMLRTAVRHPAVAELANASLVLMPVRYVPLGWAATWVTRRVLRRYVGPAVTVLEEPLIGSGWAPRNLTPEASKAEHRREGPR